MHAETYFISTLVVRSLGALVSIVCVTLVLRAWCLLPQWRTLQNYISMNQILWGAVEISWWCLLQMYSFITCLLNTKELYEKIKCQNSLPYILCMYNVQNKKMCGNSIMCNNQFMHNRCLRNCVYSNDLQRTAEATVCYGLYPFLDNPTLYNVWNVLLTSGVCWSFIAIMLALFRLVLVINKKISYEKRIVTVFALVITAVIGFLINVSDAFYVHRSDTTLLYVKIGENALKSLIASNYWSAIIIVSLALFLKIVVSVMSCCKKPMSKRRFNQIMSLVGVAVLGDIFVMIFIVIKLYQIFIFFRAVVGTFNGFVELHALYSYKIIANYFRDNNRIIDIIVDCIHVFRLVPLTAALLLNRSSREHWNRYRQRRDRLLLARL